MKKVFSLEKYTSQCAKDGFVPRYDWEFKCDGKTKEEMNAMGLLTCDEWMIELPDPVRQPPASESATSVHTSSYNDPLYGNRRVGDVVKVQGIPCIIKARKGCKGCILTGASMDLCYKYACNSYDRDDAKDVSFVRIKRF